MTSLENHGAPWSYTEENTLLTMLSLGQTVAQCSKELGRSIGGIRARQAHIAQRLLEKGMPLAKVAEITSQEIKDIKKRQPETIANVMNDIQQLVEANALKTLIRIRDDLKPKPQHCRRCGRNTHSQRECFATIHLKGYVLDSDDN